MGNNRSPGSQHNVWRYINLCNSELELIQKMVTLYFQMLKGCYLCSQWWDLTDPYFNVCPDNLKEFKKSNEKWRG